MRGRVRDCRTGACPGEMEGVGGEAGDTDRPVVDEQQLEGSQLEEEEW